MYRLVFAFIVLFITACGTAKIATPKEADALRGAQKFPGYTLADLQKGHMLYKENCGKCHGLKSPRALDEAGWRKIVPPMAKKAKIDAPTEDAILKYVVTMSGK
ncbi:MAG TPA: hypothetical protein PKL15_01200 [Saprospiraceae bacterium]|nr:hypothetical protein [Saprospiraceae bacterium]